MKIALLGKGKTGGEVEKLARHRPDITVTVCDRARPPVRERLAGHDVIISFFPGDAFREVIPTLMASEIPVVTGSTGFEWPGGIEAFSRSLAENNLAWVYGQNFSLGMNLMHEMIQVLGRAGMLYDELRYSLHEIHHIHKKDAPSGTALAWKEWLGKPVEITSERTGDVIGTHTLTLTTPLEEIAITHTARDRQIFASGAVWAARQLLMNGEILGPGLHSIRKLAMRKLRESENSGQPDAAKERKTHQKLT